MEKTVVEFYFEGKRVVFHGPSEKDHIFKSVSDSKKFYEYALLEFASSLIPTESIIIDAGANLGNHTLFFAIKCGAYIHSFEPSPAIYDLLMLNIQHNELTSQVSAYPLGCSNRKGRLSFKSGSESNSGVGQIVSGIEGSSSIDVVRADSIVQPPVDLIKIDVEGHEIPCLEGMTHFLEQKIAPSVIIEISDHERFQKISALLREYCIFPVRVFNWTPTFVFCAQEVINVKGFEVLPTQTCTDKISEFQQRVRS